MLIGVPKEIKNHEYRIGLTPASVRELIGHGHEVIVQKDGGSAIGFTDEMYEQAGAKIIDNAEEIFATADMIGKVKSGATCIAYEPVTDRFGGLPLLAPMSEVAGRMSVQCGAHHLEKAQGGLGVLLGGVPGVAPAKVLIIGGGVVGTNAAKMALGMGADVTILDRSLPRLRQLDDIFGGAVRTEYSTNDAIESHALEADLVVGAVLIPGAAAPKLLTRDIISRMKKGAVVADVAIDQGGCFETSKATTHQEPTYVVDGVVHYCVANMPGGVARTSTMALNNATLPFAVALANKGAKQALLDDANLMEGLNVHAGMVTYKAVADVLGYEYVDPKLALQKSAVDSDVAA